MLSLSADLSDAKVDIKLINGVDEFAGGGIKYGSELMRFAESVARRDQSTLIEAREQLLQAAGTEVLIDTAGVAANFQRMVRIADCTGIPLDERNMALSANVRSELKLEQFGSATNSRSTTFADKLKGYIMRPLFKRFAQRMSKKLNES